MNNNLSKVNSGKNLSDLIYNSTSDAIFLMIVEPNDVFRCISVNQAYLDQTGLQKSSVIGKTVTQILPEKAAAKAITGYRQAIKTKQPQVYEEQVDFGFGLDIVETTITPVFDQDNNCTHLIGASHNIKPQKDAQRQINMLAQTLKCINECVSITDLENNIIYVNDAFLKTYGFTEKEILGRHISIFKTSSGQSASLEEVTQATLQGGWQGEMFNKRKDGSEFPVSLSSSPVYDDEGEIIAMVGVAADITKEKQITNKLLENERWIKTIAENSPDIIYVYSVKENRNIYHNRSILQLLGYAPGEMDEYASDFLEKIIHPDDLPQYDAFFEKIDHWKKDTVFSYEYRMKSKSGEWRWFKGKEKELERKNGKVKTLIGTVQDITEKKLGEEKVRKSEERYRLLADHSSDAIAMYDAQFNPLYLSPATEALSGYSMDEINQRSIFDIVHTDDKPLLLDQIQKARKSSETKSTYEYRIIHKKGYPVWVETISNSVYKNGILHRIITVNRDITLRKNAEKAILERNEKFRLLSHAATGMLNLKDVTAILKHIAFNMQSQYPDTVVLVVSIDEEKKMTRLEALEGVDKSYVAKIAGMAGFEPVGKEYKLLPDHLHYFRTGKFTEFPGGLAEFASTEFPAWIAKMIQKTMGIHKIYTIGINNEDQLLAAIHFMTLNKTTITDHDYIDSFIQQAGIIIQQNLTYKNLVASEEKYRLITENTTDTIVVMEADKTLKYISPSSVKLNGWTPEECMRKGIDNLVVPESLKKLNVFAEQILDPSFLENQPGKKDLQLELEIYHKNGSTVWAEVGITPLKNDSGKITGVVGVARDISERLKTDERLRFQGLILDQIYDLVTVTDLEGKITYVNNAVIKNTCRTHEELIGENVKIYGEESGKGATQNEIIEKTKTNGFWSGEIVNFTKDGHRIELEVRSQLIKDKEGNPIALCGISTDISLRKKAENQLLTAKEKAEAADHLKTAFLNNISHEVRTPLNGILGFADLISEPDISEEMRKNYLQILRESGERLMQTITDFMDISLITSGNMDVNLHDVEPSNELKIIEDEFRKKAKEKELDLKLDLPDDGDLLFRTDPELLRKIMHHLMGNAMKFTKSGSITFGYRKSADHLRFFVSDTGKGISPSAMEIIFQPFGQEDPSITRGHEGSGLGLSIAKGMAELLGGSLTVESEVGKGSAFHIDLPVGSKINRVKEQDYIAETKAPGGIPVILVAEDDAISFKYFEILFRRFQVKLLHARTGNEAVAIAGKHPEISLVLMDLKMPGMNGLEATRHIKKHRPDLPVIAQTSHALSGDTHRALQAGCDDYLTKPLNKNILLKTIEKYGIKLTLNKNNL